MIVIQNLHKSVTMPSTSAKPIEIAIVGGGMGGLCLAIGLLKYSNLRVQIYEAAQKFNEVGAGVAFGPNSLRAMRLISPSVEAAYLRRATSNAWKVHATTSFQYRQGQGPNEGDLIAAPENETGQSNVHRAHFLDEFIKLIPKEVANFGKRLECIEDGGVSGVKLHFRDGTTVVADALVGADGVHSITRKFLLGENHPATNSVFTGYVAYRGLVPMEIAVAKISANFAQNGHIWACKDRVIATYPIDSGKTMNVTAINMSYKSWTKEDRVILSDPKRIIQEFSDCGKTVRSIVEVCEKAE